MTRNQIEYANYVETNRHQLATEAETSRNNRAVLKEQHRSNRANEKESVRTHKANEKISRYNAKETKRHNKATEKLTGQANAEQGRHNLATETETARANRAGEANQRYAVDRNVAASMYNASVNAQAHLAGSQIAANASMANAATQAETADKDRQSRQLIASWQNAITRVQNSREMTIKERQQELDKLKIEVDQAYKEGLIQQQQYNNINTMMRDAANTAIKMK